MYGFDASGGFAIKDEVEDGNSVDPAQAATPALVAAMSVSQAPLNGVDKALALTLSKGRPVRRSEPRDAGAFASWAREREKRSAAGRRL